MGDPLSTRRERRLLSTALPLLAIATVALPAPPAAAAFDKQEKSALAAIFPEGQFSVGEQGQAYFDLGGRKAVEEKYVALLRADFDGLRGKEVFIAYSILDKYDPTADSFVQAEPHAAVLACKGRCTVQAAPVALADEGRVREVSAAPLGTQDRTVGLVVYDSGAAPVKTFVAATLTGDDDALKVAARILRDDPEDSGLVGDVRLHDLDDDGVKELCFNGRRTTIADAYSGERGAYLASVYRYERSSTTFDLEFGVQVSSVLHAGKDDFWTHGPLMMFDGQNATAWCEGTSDFGVAEFIRLEYPEKTDFTTIQMMPGWGQNARTFMSHNQVKTFTVESASPKKFGYTFPESIRELQTIELLRPIKTEWARIWIQEIFSARKDVTCVSVFVLE